VQKSVVFQTVASVNKKLDKISIKHLTINKTLDILKSSIKHLKHKSEHRDSPTGREGKSI
jgi:hypothetical protein